MQPTKHKIQYAAISLGAVLLAEVHAQTAAPPNDPPQTPAADDEVVVLNPFEVTAANDKGYIATNTLGGTRINTELRDLGSAISVVTSQFLKDTGATNNTSLLQFTTNTEVAGVAGNFGGMGNTTQVSERTQLLRPNANTRVRGLDAADNTRDFFLSNVPWDSYNVERVDIQRGANAMLFGVGSPAGIINANLNPAKFENSNKIENRFGSYGSLRTSVDFNYALVENQLAVRLAALDDHAKFQQKPAFSRDQRLYLALRYDPKFLNTENMRTSFKANIEWGDVDANRPRSLPPIDTITPWFLTGTATDNAGHTFNNLNRGIWDPRVAWSNNGGIAKTGSANYIPWFNQAHFGQAFGASLNLLYNADSATPIKVHAPFVTTYRGIYSKTGDVFDASFDRYTGQIPGNPYSQTIGIATFSNYATGSSLPGAQYGAWSDKSLTDPSIYDFYNNLIDGKNKREWQNWKALNLDFNQSFFANRIAYDLAFSHESYRDGQMTFLDGQQYQISVDINANYMDGSANPNAGRPYVSGKGTWGNGQNSLSRDALHATLTGDLRASDLFGRDSVWTKILGHHQLTGLYSRDKKLEENRQFARWAMDPSWATTLGDADTTLMNRVRAVDYAVYIGPNLQNRTTASGANLSRVRFDATPQSSYDIYYFDSTWAKSTSPTNPNYVDPNAPFVFYDPLTGQSTDSSQAGNPANYVGWTTTKAKVLDADKGDIDQLTFAASRTKVLVSSWAANWQGFLFDDSLVVTYGFRHDKLKQTSAGAATDDDGIIIPSSYELAGRPATVVSDDTSLWSVVLHTPKQLRKRLPWGTDISLFYNRSNNWNAQSTRLDIEGNLIPNSKGKTKEYGVLISTFDDRVSFKVNWYETNVTDATLQGDGAGLGSSGISSMLQVEAVGAGNAAVLARGIYNGRGQPWGWDYAWNDNSTGYGANPRDPAGAATDTMEKAAIQSWIDQLPSQQFFDNYGIPISVSALKAGDWDHAITTVTAAYLDTQGNSGDAVGNSYDGTIQGISPVATCDTTSKGIEFELTAQPLHNLNLSVNVAKTESTRTNLSGKLENFILRQKALMDSPAGDIRQWWAGDRTLRTVWTSSVWGPYLNLKAQDGSAAPEVRPWRYNVVANYSFDRGWLKGFNVGGAYRWQQGAILGYALQSYTDPAKMIPDVSKPFKSPSEDGIDLWVGYERKLTDKVNWRIQLNVRNVGDKAHLIPISIQPDGSAAQFRIAEEQTWSITNTFTF
ncbi:MAG: TonB-dependent receptor plug domain-containing protein [Opitutaceae bacterium]